MTEPRILVAGSAYIHDEGLRELCKLWSRCVQHLDPNVDIVVIDSVSPFEPAVFLEWPQIDESEEHGDIGSRPLRFVYRFKENIGHLSRGGQDGAGRTFCKSIELGIEGGYDYVAILETDLLLFRSVTDIVGRMQRNGTKICAMPNMQYNFPEFGVCFIDCKWAKEFDLVGKYDWLKSQPWPIPEIRIMNIVKDYLMLLPEYGVRIDQTGLTAQSLPNAFAYYPPAWLTHAPNLDIYMKGVMMNGIQLK